MASPIELFVVPNIGLQVEFFGDGFQSFFGKTSVSKKPSAGKSNSPGKRGVKEQLQYRVQSTEVKHFIGVAERSFVGGCAPFSTVTLPSAVRRMAGIPPDACYYTFIHPPPDLARDIDWSKFDMATIDKDDELAIKHYWAVPLIALLGGYVYLDEDLKIVSVNALSLSQTPYDLKLSGPFAPLDIAKKELCAAKRAHPITMEYFHEVGIVASAWIRPGEKFRGHLATEDRHYNHGCFMFFRDDGSAIVYSLDPSGFIDPNGETSSLADAFQSSSKVKLFIKKNIGFVTNYKFSTEEQLKKTRLAIADIDNDRQKADYLHSVGDARTLIHHACKARCDVATIRGLLDGDEVAKKNLLYQDELGFTPLHYACRHDAQKGELVRLLIDRSPDSVFIRDHFDRCALHIACDSNASLEVIAALVDADPLRNVLYQKTKLLHRLPIHIACYKKLSEEAIQHLVNADEDSVALAKKTKAGRLPLHMAIEKKLSTNVIKLLIGETAESSFHTPDAIEISLNRVGNSNQRRSITSRFKGMIPLHIACWNNSSPDTIKALLDADEANVTVDMEVEKDSPILQRSDFLDEEEHASSRYLQNASYSISHSFSKSRDEEEPRALTVRDLASRNDRAPDEVKCSLAIHLAAKNGSAEVMSLLLEKEKEKMRIDGEEDNVMFQDHCGRTPLHIVLRSNVDPSIVRALLDFDEHGETTQMNDDWGFKPIHYACEREDASEDTVKLLIEAEDRYIAHKLHNDIDYKVKRSTHTCEDRKRSPLYLAVKAGAPESVIEKLLDPDHFYLKGFDSDLVGGLSAMAVKNKIIQGHIIEKLSERCYFTLLFSDIYANACALAFFLYGSQKLVEGEMDIAAPLVLCVCIIMFVFRELIQIKSQTSQFFVDPWNWCQILAITLLALSTEHMMEEVGKPDPDIKRTLLTMAGALLIAQFTFFLRSTFLPFARFVGGLTTIFATLIPFFIVSALLLLAFAYGFFIQGDNDACPNITECYAWTLGGFFSGSDETNTVLDVLFGVIAIVVLLNVVIAIVSEAWETAQERALNLFWKFRLEFLSEARFFAYLEKRIIHGGFLDSLGNKIDELRDVKFVDHISWSKAPYSRVSCKKQYDKPFEYFSPDLAKLIFESKSLQADLYWTKTDSKRKERTDARKRILYMAALFKWIASAALYGFLCLIGLCTAGWLWPKNLRKKLLGVGLNYLPKDKTVAG